MSHLGCFLIMIFSNFSISNDYPANVKRIIFNGISTLFHHIQKTEMKKKYAFEVLILPTIFELENTN